ncbi:MAG: DUF192 domain-containing protein [Candidatus Uhrbacteria bacterium]
MKSWHRIIISLGSLTLVLAVIFLWWFRVARVPSNPTDHEMRRLTVNGKTIWAEVVTTNADLEQGLSDRLSMPKNQGMLFELRTVGIHSFWMIRMHFPLDIIWLNGNRVVEIAPSLPAPGTSGIPVTHTPTIESDRVLELNAGIAEELELRVGDTIQD